MVMPSTFNRFCLWHILNKFSEKMNVMVYNEQYHMLVNIIKNSESSFEFEERWSAIMVSTSLDCNEWLTSMYELRTRWVPAYVKHIFSAGMSSSQRCSYHMREFDSLHIRIKELDDEGNGSFSRNMSKSREQSEPIGDPTVIRAKGCGKRLKSSKEKSLSKNSRQCRCCGENGHDKRTCPRLNDRSNMEMYQPNLHDLPSTQDDGRDDATLASNASSHFHFGNWFG
ncbi:Protein FAR1-RELATED SEQUENCE [Abeliophyllum distichum]|uniref:Protein FAR1-RELATED SEQUENCE n=1 Tax=Abeliophyllum distichum TaxID=126358 RepID=A0ABD1V807_9LAMI